MKLFEIYTQDEQIEAAFFRYFHYEKAFIKLWGEMADAAHTHYRDPAEVRSKNIYGLIQEHPQDFIVKQKTDCCKEFNDHYKLYGGKQVLPVHSLVSSFWKLWTPNKLDRLQALWHRLDDFSAPYCEKWGTK